MVSLRSDANLLARLIRLAFFCALFITIHSPAQSGTASISGVIMDSTEAVIPNASLSLQNVATGVTAQNATNSKGIFSIVGILPGKYRLLVTKEGFAPTTLENITLSVGDKKNLVIRLKIGSDQQAVSVDASGLVLNTTDASVGTVIDRRFVENLPLNGRSFQDLISMTPGVVTQSPQSSSSTSYNGDFSVNGQRTESNYYTVDGVTGNINAGNGRGQPQAGAAGAIAGGTALGTTQSLISVDALQEFRVVSSSYSAEYGRSPGGQFVLATRSGTNMLHGTLFNYLRNDVFDANDWFNDHNFKAKAPLRQNDFGGTLGGPVIIPQIYSGKDKTFFFVSYEGLRLTQPIAATIQYVPDTCMRQNAPAALKPILNAYPIQNGTDYGTCNGSTTSPSLAQFIQPYSLPAHINSTSVRADHLLTPKINVFFRVGYTPSFISSRTLSSLTRSVNNSSTYTLGLTQQISERNSNEFRLGYSRANSEANLTLDSFGGAAPIDLASAMGIGAYSSTYPLFQLSFASIGTAAISTEAAENLGRQWNLTDNYTFATGKHLLRFGIDYRQIKSVLNYPGVSASATFRSNTSVSNNLADSLNIGKYAHTTPIFNETALYAQDEWKLTLRLSLSLGIRWEVDPPPTEQHGNDAYTLSGSISSPSTVALAPLGTPLWKTTYYNFAPRMGVSWLAHSSRGYETVIRAGGGVFFDSDNQQATQGFQAVGYGTSKAYANVPVPATTSQLNIAPSSAPPYTSSVVYAFPSHLQLPYTLQWNAAVQQALGKDQAFTLTYVGSEGRRLTQYQEIYLTPSNPIFGYAIYLASNYTSNYQALQMQFQRSVQHGVQALASYTWSHSLDYGSTNSALTAVRGNSDFDVRHNAQAGLSWDIANGKGYSQLVQRLTSGWGLDGRLILRSGFPVPLNGSFVNNPATNTYYYSGVNLVPGQPLYLYGSQYPGGRQVNKATFTAAPSGTTGNAPRNFVRGFGASQVNLSARRAFPLTETVALQFRAEAFNILNHPNFGYVDPTLANATFGQATKMLNQSLGTVAAQYQQGGARSIQFALKVIF